MKKTIIACVVVAIFCLAGWYISNIAHENTSVDEYANYDLGKVLFGNKSYPVFISNTPRLLSKGLSGKTELPQDHGMLFVFGSPSVNYFWMKEMNFPLDIIWIDELGTIIHIEEGLIPETYPDLFGPDKDSMYVWEVNAGFAAEKGIDIGGRIGIEL